MTFISGVPIFEPNTIVAEHPDFYVSYNAYDRAIYGSDTTAIVTGNMEHFYVLNGDHSKELKGASLAACLNYFKINTHLKNKYSEVYNG